MFVIFVRGVFFFQPFFLDKLTMAESEYRAFEWDIGGVEMLGLLATSDFQTGADARVVCLRRPFSLF